MIASSEIDDRMRRAFAPTSGGIVALTDQILSACIGSDVELTRVGNQIVSRWTSDAETVETPAPLPVAGFRTILARVAALCAESNPDTVTPYGGDVSLTLKGPPPTAVRVVFANTPSEQRLEICSTNATIRPNLPANTNS